MVDVVDSCGLQVIWQIEGKTKGQWVDLSIMQCWHLEKCFRAGTVNRYFWRDVNNRYDTGSWYTCDVTIKPMCQI